MHVGGGEAHVTSHSSVNACDNRAYRHIPASAYADAMSDLSRHLPLSNRPRADESAVTGDWRAALAEVVERFAALAPDAAATARLLTATRLDAEFPSAAIPHVASAVRVGQRRKIKPVVDGTRVLLEVAGERDVPLSATVSGAVALYAATRMPFARRAALAGSSVHATDADWSFGRGPVREATAREILDFVLELNDTPPPLQR